MKDTKRCLFTETARSSVLTDSDGDVGFIISGLGACQQRVNGAVVVVGVRERDASVAYVRVGVNLADQVVVGLIHLHVDLVVAQELRLVYTVKQRPHTRPSAASSQTSFVMRPS